MSVEETRETLRQYAEALSARGDFGRFFDADIDFSVVGTDQCVRGAEAAEAAIRFMHESAFDARPEITKVLVGDDAAAVELVFVGTHTGDFAGVAATGNAVRVPYAAFYDLKDGRIAALRIYMPMDELVRQAQGERPAEAGQGAA
jgi:predicted ester cyclase